MAASGATLRTSTYVRWHGRLQTSYSMNIPVDHEPGGSQAGHCRDLRIAICPASGWPRSVWRPGSGRQDVIANVIDEKVEDCPDSWRMFLRDNWTTWTGRLVGGKFGISRINRPDHIPVGQNMRKHGETTLLLTESCHCNPTHYPERPMQLSDTHCVFWNDNRVGLL